MGFKGPLYYSHYNTEPPKIEKVIIKAPIVGLRLRASKNLVSTPNVTYLVARVRSKATILITPIRVLITLLAKSHDPLSTMIL